MQETLLQTMQSFLLHNWPLVLFGGLAIIFLLITLIINSRRWLYFFIGFTSWALNFEYNKHLFIKIQTDMINLIFPEGTRFTIYNFVILFFKYGLPLLMIFLGGLFVLLGLLVKPKKKDL